MHPDHREYYRFTGPQRLDKAFHSLEGILYGITADDQINATEVQTLQAWLNAHEDIVDRDAFRDVADALRKAIADSIVDDDELEDLRWKCKRFQTGDQFFDAITSDLQRLHALVGAIAADGVITVEELRGLREWLDDHETLRSNWPYDEIDTHVTSALADGKIDATEHARLLAFFSEFIDLGDHKALSDQMQSILNDAKTPISGLCAVCPTIEFPGKLFCFTGSSARAKRKDIEKIVKKAGGEFSSTIGRKTDYLVVGGEGNPTWAFSCYGRKVEAATRIRREGGKVLIIHEFDFWDCIEALG